MTRFLKVRWLVPVAFVILMSLGIGLVAAGGRRRRDGTAFARSPQRLVSSPATKRCLQGIS